VTFFGFSMEAGDRAEPRRWRDHQNLQLEAPCRSVLHTFHGQFNVLCRFLQLVVDSCEVGHGPKGGVTTKLPSWWLLVRAFSTGLSVIGAHRTAFCQKNEGPVRSCSASRWRLEVGLKVLCFLLQLLDRSSEVGRSPLGGVNTNQLLC
jgi:hypothetical protein